jgi:hypothetical protein
MRANWRAIWDLGEVAYRWEVLRFVEKHELTGSWDLCWEALDAEDYEGMLHESALFSLLTLTRSRRLTDGELEVIVRAVRTEIRIPPRMFALMILEQKQYSGLETLLLELAQDKNIEVAFEANLRLRARGFDTADAMLGAIPYSRDMDFAISMIWWQRKDLPLASEQDALLMKYMVRVATKIRDRFWSYPESPSALKLCEYLQRGVPIEEGDLDNIARSVFVYRESRRWRTTGRRIKIVSAVAWFANDRAREWLGVIRDSTQLPLNVRTVAKRELRKLDGATKRRRGARGRG